MMMFTGKIAGNMPLNKKASTLFTVGYSLLFGIILSLVSLLMFEPDPMVIAGCFVVGIVIALGVVGDMRKEVLNVEFKDDASGYTDPGGIRLTVRQDRFLYTRVSRTPKPQQQSGGSRGPGRH